MFVEILLACCIIILLWRWNKSDYYTKLHKIKHEPYIPFVGHALKLGTDNTKLLTVLKKMWNNLGRDKFLLKLGPLQQVVLTKPEDIEVILTSNVLIEKSGIYKFVKPWIGNGLVLSTGNEWRVHRKLLTPAFHYKLLETYLDTIEKYGKRMIEGLLKHQDNFELTSLIASHSIRIMSGSALGFDIDKDEDNSVDKIIGSIMTLKYLINSRMFSVWKCIEPLYRLTSDFAAVNKCLKVIIDYNLKILNSKREEMKDLIAAVASGEVSVESLTKDKGFLSKRKLTFIELLLLSKKPDGTPFTNDEIVDEARTFINVGHETVTSAMAFTLYSLATNPEVQQKVYEEQLAITGGDLDQPVTLSVIHEMNYLERVIKESLRMYSPIIFFGRKITKETILPDGTILPKDCMILIIPYLTHNNPDLYEHPDRFDPDRFMDNKVNPYAYYPFSAGPRNCIGQRLAMVVIKSWVAVMTRSLEILPSEKPLGKLSVELTIKAENGVHVCVRPRQPKTE